MPDSKIRRHADGTPWTTQDFADYLAGWQRSRLPWTKVVVVESVSQYLCGSREAKYS